MRHEVNGSCVAVNVGVGVRVVVVCVVVTSAAPVPVVVDWAIGHGHVARAART